MSNHGINEQLCIGYKQYEVDNIDENEWTWKYITIKEVKNQ